MSQEWQDTAAAYRVTPRNDGFQPEMLYKCKHGELWVPLKEDGYWADPDAYSTGKVTCSSVMDEATARTAIWRARLVNKDHRP